MNRTGKFCFIPQGMIATLELHQGLLDANIQKAFRGSAVPSTFPYQFKLSLQYLLRLHWCWQSYTPIKKAT